MTSSRPDPGESTILAYSEGASAYAEHSRDRNGLVRLRGRLMALLPAQPLILDLGSGPGHDSALMSDLGATVVALDPAVGLLIEALRYRRIGTRLVAAQAQRLPFIDASFDGVWACASLLHVSHEEVPLALAEVQRVLKPGGVALFSMSEGEPSGLVPVVDMGLATRVYYYHRAEDWGRLVEAAGLELLDHQVNRASGNFNPGSTGWMETFARRRLNAGKPGCSVDNCNLC